MSLSEPVENDKCPVLKPTELFISYNKKRALIDTFVSDNRLGRLPTQIQTFLNSKYTANKLEVNSKKLVLLRYGLAKTLNNKHTFLSCLADVYSFSQDKYKNKTISNEDFRKLLTEKLTIDFYLSLHNGSIASLFQPAPGSSVDLSININDYKESKLYKSIDQSDETQKEFLQYTIASYENFKKYLLDSNNVIEPTYMWEIVSSNLLFCNGYNMVIVEHFEENNQVGIMCPNNPYVSPIFNPSKRTFILLKQKNVYTPLYLIRSEERKDKIRTDRREEIFYLTKVFEFNASTPTMNAILKMLEKNINLYCSPRNPQLSKAYTFEHGLNAVQTKAVIRQHKDLLIKHAVWNYQGKIVAFLIQWNNSPVHVKHKGTFYLPCFPSTVNSEFFQVKWVDDENNWTDYTSTIAFLQHIHEIGQTMNIKIPCKPKTRVVQDGNIIGILTDSHHFVQINPSIKHETIENDILNNTKPIIHSNPIVADKNLAIFKPSIVQNPQNHALWVEQEFYIVFRNKLRILLNEFSQSKTKKQEILETVKNNDLTSEKKIQKIQTYLIELGKTHFVFADYSEAEMMKLKKISLCDGTCENNTSYCVRQESGHCALKIPKTNLVTQDNNEVSYYKRLAEELIHNRNTFLYMLQNNYYIDYDVRNTSIQTNEMLLPQSKMNTKYFRSLNARDNSKYVNRNNYMTTSGKISDMVLNWKKEMVPS